MHKVTVKKANYFVEPDAGELLLLSRESAMLAQNSDDRAVVSMARSARFNTLREFYALLEAMGHPEPMAVASALEPEIDRVLEAKARLKAAVYGQLHLYCDRDGRPHPKGDFHWPSTSSDA